MKIIARADGQLRTFNGAAEWSAFMDDRARRRYPERYAPNGEPLIGYDGDTWEKRRASWEKKHRSAGTREPSTSDASGDTGPGDGQEAGVDGSVVPASEGTPS